jgi:hypothetical protein
MRLHEQVETLLLLDSISITSYGVIMEIYKDLKSKFNQLSFRVRFILIGWILIITLFLLYSIFIVLMHPIFLNYVNKSSTLLDKYNSQIVSTDVSYEGKNSQIVVKTVEYENLSTDEIIRTLKVDNVDLVSTNDSDAILFDKANKVKIVIKTENNVTIVKFYY